MARFYKFFSIKSSSNEKRDAFFYIESFLEPPADFLRDELSLSCVPILFAVFLCAAWAATKY